MILNFKMKLKQKIKVNTKSLALHNVIKFIIDVKKQNKPILSANRTLHVYFKIE
jgi:hypothetical protein